MRTPPPPRGPAVILLAQLRHSKKCQPSLLTGLRAENIICCCCNLSAVGFITLLKLPEQTASQLTNCLSSASFVITAPRNASIAPVHVQVLSYLPSRYRTHHTHRLVNNSEPSNEHESNEILSRRFLSFGLTNNGENKRTEECQVWHAHACMLNHILIAFI